ncbi:PAP2-domain-containing protein [Exidia glandulosa HHB12029]|uniref:PAP2-domain-containing protein n=1 Tax=Exidia glandulosa HHB12029 TaxID=1314781 RepID=A0A165KSJ0_EXIGL|nr:PAP2-domain-containing protein [Exidia glandulosa HHB12029]
MSKVIETPTRCCRVVTALLFFAARAVDSLSPFERPIPLNDASISSTYTTEPRVGGWLLLLLSLWIPLGVAILNGLVHRSSMELHHGCLALLSGRFLMDLVVDSMKNRVGRLRPDFLDRCKWDAVANRCTGKANVILDGRRSFPSGHSSSGFTGLGFVALLLATKLLAPPAGTGLLSSRLLRFSIVFSPVCLAAWIAITRLEDYRHHVEDVLAGSLIGALCILVTYHIYWPSPLIRLDAQSSSPRMVYGNAGALRNRDGFELTRMEFEDEDSGERV